MNRIKELLLQLDGVVSVEYNENLTLYSTDELPPKSFEFIVEGGDEDDIAEVIAYNNSIGVRSVGNVSVVVNMEGFTYKANFTRKEDKMIQLKVGDKVRRVEDCPPNFPKGSIHTVASLCELGDFYVEGLPDWICSLSERYWELIKKETTTMSTKIEQAEKRIEEAMEQLEAAKLALKEAEEVKKNPLFGEIGNDNDLHQLNCTSTGGLTGTSSTYRTSAREVGFTDRKSAGLVAEAISTLLLLRSQEGVTSKSGEMHFLYDNKISVSWGSALEIVPHFKPKGLAHAATLVVGEARLIRMFKIFNGEAV